jgi:hypothetical protein
MADRMYSGGEAAGGTGDAGDTGDVGGTGTGTTGQGSSTTQEPPKDNVVDAEFEEVKKD